MPDFRVTPEAPLLFSESFPLFTTSLKVWIQSAFRKIPSKPSLFPSFRVLSAPEWGGILPSSCQFWGQNSPTWNKSVIRWFSFKDVWPTLPLIYIHYFVMIVLWSFSQLLTEKRTEVFHTLINLLPKLTAPLNTYLTIFLVAWGNLSRTKKNYRFIWYDNHMLLRLLIASVKNIQNHSKKKKQTNNKLFRPKQRQEQNSKAVSTPSPTWRTRKSYSFIFRCRRRWDFVELLLRSENIFLEEVLGKVSNYSLVL